MTGQNAPDRIAIYVRISKDDAGYAYGVQDQVRQCREAITRQWPRAKIVVLACGCRDCQRFDIPPDVFCDNDLTASGKVTRPHYERMLAAITAGEIDRVVAVHNDRLHRNVRELEDYIDACEPHGVPTNFVKASDLDLSTSGGRMTARIVGVVARNEWERMVERQLGAKRRNREAGMRQSGTRPFGYDFDARDDRGRQTPGSKGLVINEPEAAAIRDGCRAVLAAGAQADTAAIAHRWNDAGLRTPVREARNGKIIGGKSWTGIGVLRVLIRAQNAGLIEHDGEIVGPARWTAIVTPDTWRAVKAALTDPSRRTSPGPAPRWILQGALICGVCGCRRFRVARGGARHPEFKYQCGSMFADRDNPASGWHLSRDARMLEAHVEQIVIERLRRPDALAAMAGPAVDVAALQARRAEITAEIAEWNAEPGIRPAELAARLAPMYADRDDLDAKITAALRSAGMADLGDLGDPADVWARLKAEGNVERMRAIIMTMMRVKVLPTGRTGRPANSHGQWMPGDPWVWTDPGLEILPADA